VFPLLAMPIWSEDEMKRLRAARRVPPLTTEKLSLYDWLLIAFWGGLLIYGVWRVFVKHG
jgi:hypothetical protein